MIQCENITYHYKEETEANLDAVTFRIQRGEFVVIAGKSGCGKTTLARCINGLIPHFEEGQLQKNIFLMGQNTREMKIGQIGEIVGSVFQDPRSQFFTTTVFDELAFGCRNAGLSRDEILKRIDMTVREMGIENLKDRNLLTLSSGEKQKVAIASCYCMKPQIFMFDEPSANLDPQSVMELRGMLQKLKEMGHTIVVFEHRLYYLCNLPDRFAVMDKGMFQKIYTKEELCEITEAQLIAMGLRSFYPKEIAMKHTLSESNMVMEQSALLEVEHLKFRYNKGEASILEEVSLKVKQGEIIALVGNNGEGKTTFAKVLTGLLKEQSGTIKINHQNMTQKQRLREMYYVLQDSDYQLFAESVEKELLMGIEHTSEKREQLERILSEFELQPYRMQHPMALSRGQKQRVTIAAAMMSDAKILILDEPSSGLDGENMRRLAKVLREIALTGKAILIISHDAEFIEVCAQRVVELRKGGFYEQQE